MDRSFFKYSVFFGSLLLIWLVVTSQAWGSVTYNGRLGVDYEFHDYDATATRLTRLLTYRRAISNHFLEAAVRGPIVNEDFATFNARSSLYGTYFRAANADSSTTAYLDPDIRSIGGQLSLFPTRRYTLDLSYSQSEDYVLEYEDKNRKIDGVQRSELHVIRRYDSKSTASGAELKVEATDEITLKTSISKTKSSSVRFYEFSEDKDLYASFEIANLLDPPTPIGIDTDTSWVFNLAVINEDTLSGVWVRFVLDEDFFGTPGNPDFLDPTKTQIDSVYVTHLSDTTSGSAFFQIVLEYDIGQYDDHDDDIRNNWEEFIVDFTNALHTVYVLPDTLYNQSITLAAIPGDMILNISQVDPASPNDMSSEGNEFSTMVVYENETGLKNSSEVKAGKREDLFQGIKGEELILSNNLLWDLDQEKSIMMTTSKFDGNTVLRNGKRQENSSFSNMTEGRYFVYGGTSASLAHMYNTSVSDDGITKSTNSMNSLKGTFATPTGYKDHIISGSVTGLWTTTESDLPFDTTFEIGGVSQDTSYMKTSTGSSSTYMAQIDNSFTMQEWGMKFSPKNLLKYQIQGQEGIPTKRKFESTTGLSSEVANHKIFGRVALRLQHGYMRDMTDFNFTTTSKMSADFDVSRYLHTNFKLKASIGYLLSTFGGESQAEGSSEVVEVSKPSLSQIGYGFSSTWVLGDVAIINSGYRASIQATSSSTTFSTNLQMNVPLIDATFESNLSNQIREVQDQSPQTKLSFENQLAFSIRRIALLFEYEYAREERFGEVYTYNLLTGKITRSF